MSEEELIDRLLGSPIDAENAEEVTAAIKKAAELEERPAFAEGLAERLRELGVECEAEDREMMLSEVKRRYREILGKSCPRTVQEWVRGTTPGITNRQNNYELCFALEMDLRRTAEFFERHFLTMPFNVKSRTDAVFFYCLCHKKSYSTACRLLEGAKGFVSQEKAHTSTSRIAAMIFETEDEDIFLKYLSEHCYDSEQQFILAKRIISSELDTVGERLMRFDNERAKRADRLGSLTIEALLGYKYQEKGSRVRELRLPKRFTESLPNDVTLGRIKNGQGVSYELLRKTMVLLKFYNFYFDADNCDGETIRSNLLDFYGELDQALISCGFAQLYPGHPFDCLMLYCANSYDPIDTLYCVIENWRNAFL